MARRYIYTNAIKDKDTGKRYYQSTIYPKIKATDNDLYIISEDGDRLDLLANKYYNDKNLWWVIAVANNINDGTFYVEAGRQLRVPSDITTILNDLSKINKYVMGFPYFSPLSPWIVDIMTDREKNPVLSSVKNPFVILTSGALVVNGTASDDFVARKTELANIINDLKGSPKSYKGCIISNNINNTDLTYTKNETIVGVDFTGEYIKVQGESGRYISTPIIETLDIDTDGANNTLKTARVSVRVFSLKQLELFEMFFMKPGMNVLVEFGDGSMFKVNKNIRTKKYDAYNSSGEKIDFSPFSDVSHALIPKKDYKEFYESFSDYYRASVKAFANYTTRLQQSLGTYDFVAGKVTDYNFSIESDGTYMVSIEITQGNQISMAIPVKPKKIKDKKIYKTVTMHQQNQNKLLI